MTDAGWFPDPQNPGAELFFDGHTWTGQRRWVASSSPVASPASDPPSQTAPLPAIPPVPGAWQAPAPQWGYGPQPGYPYGPQPGGWAPTGAEAAWSPPPVPRRSRRKPLLLALAAVVVVAAGLVTWLVWPGDDQPQLTHQGKDVAAPSEALTRAETALHTYVKSRHGAENGTTRCYFQQPVQPASGVNRTDVKDALLCGPVLFVDGDTARPYVSVQLTADQASGQNVTLTPPNSLSALTPQAVGAGVKLARPDGKHEPPGAGGLTVPKPPPADPDVLTSSALGPTPSPQSLSAARMVGKDTGVTLEAAGEIPRYGSSEDARSAPSGQKLIAFQVTYGEGDVSGAGSGQVRLVVDGGTPRDVPETSGSDEWDVVALPTAAAAVLQLENGGYTQTLTLPDGKPGSDNLAVLARKHRTAVIAKSASVPIHLSNGNGSANVTFRAKATLASLDFWVPGHETHHAKDAKHAILSVKLNYTDSSSPGQTFGFDPQLLRLKLADGTTIRARNVATGNFIFDVFDVPATFTGGTIQITGSEKVDGITVQVRKTVGFAVGIPAG